MLLPKKIYNLSLPKVVIGVLLVTTLLIASYSRASAVLPNPMVYEVKDSNGSIMQVLLSSGLGHERTYVYNTQWGIGIRTPDPNAMVTRIASDVLFYHPSVVLIEMGTVDTEFPDVYNNYSAAIDQVMTHVTVPVVWLQVPLQNMVAPYTVAGANTINAALQTAERRYPNLWAVSTQSVWDQAYGAGKCPVLSPGLVRTAALSECFGALGTDVHYNLNGFLAAGIIEDTAIELAISGKSRNNLVTDIQALLRAIGP